MSFIPANSRIVVSVYLMYLAFTLTATAEPNLAPVISPATAGTAKIGRSEPYMK